MLRKDSMKLEKAKEKIKKDGVEVKQVSEKLKKDSVKLNKVKAKEQYKDNMGQQQQSAECVMLLLLARSEECRDVDKAELGSDVRELKLLARMFDCTEGAIMVGDRDVRELKLLAMTKECMDMGKAKMGRDKELEAHQQGQERTTWTSSIRAQSVRCRCWPGSRIPWRWAKLSWPVPPPGSKTGTRWTSSSRSAPGHRTRPRGETR